MRPICLFFLTSLQVQASTNADYVKMPKIGPVNRSTDLSVSLYSPPCLKRLYSSFVSPW